MPRALTLTWLCAQLTVTEVLSSLSTVMLTPQPADAGCVEAPTTPVAARAEARRMVLSFMRCPLLDPPGIGGLGDTVTPAC